MRFCAPVAGLTVAFTAPARAITPQQAFVMYSGEVCLGCAPVLHPGQTLHEIFRSVRGASQQASPVMGGQGMHEGCQ